MTLSASKILIVEDEPSVRTGLEDNLKFEGYEVISRENGILGLEAYEKESPDLVILDVMMPGVDGLEVCKRIRAFGRGTPIIMLTAKGSELDKVVGLEIGADDYLTKPFAIRELFARVRALLRRSKSLLNGTEKKEDTKGSSLADEITFGQVTVDFRCYRAKKGEEDIALSAKEFELLRYLASHPDIPLTRDQLLDQVWGYNSYPTTRTVDNFIARLRHKMEASPERPQHIVTVHGVGYKFVH